MEASLYGFTKAEDPIRNHGPYNYPTQGATEPHPTHSLRRETAADKESRQQSQTLSSQAIHQIFYLFPADITKKKKKLGKDFRNYIASWMFTEHCF